MLIQAQNLTRIYRVGSADVAALRDVSFDIAAGESIAVTGPSGAGKSTLMHILGCLEKPSQGKYILQGKDVSQLTDDQLSRIRGSAIGFVFQSYNLAPHLNVLENVMLAPFYIRDHSREAKSRCIEAIELVGLSKRIKHRPAELSGGERQRVAIARALANDPLLILADEPTGNLDTETGNGIMQLIEHLHNDGKTIIIVTHDQRVADRAQRQIHLVDGRIQKEERV